VTGPPGYPFTALVGQETLRLALVVNAINPRLGGVLIRGQKGTAKSTAARGLAHLLLPIDVVDHCRFGCDPQPSATRCPDCSAREAAGETPLPRNTRTATFVELPIGATEDRVLGSLDLERALKQGERHFEPGLLARANRGLLYVDEVNLLPDHLVDSLLDAAAMGVNTVEREGLSFSHPAAFVLVGTMNPEEGELRPQLLDRFALAVDVAGMPDPAQRAEVVRRRIAYEADPVPFAHNWSAAESAERGRIQAARTLLPQVKLADALLDLIARIATEFEVDGLRADLVMYKTAVTLAAYHGRCDVTVDDVRQAAELALSHRRRRQPFDDHGLDRERLDRLVDEHVQDGGQTESPDNEPHDGDPPPERPGAPPVREQVFEVQPVELTPPPPVARSTVTTRSPRNVAGRRGTPIESTLGRHVRSVPLRLAHSRSLDVAATLLAAAPHQLARRAHDGGDGRLRLEHRDARVKLRHSRARRCTLFVVDASGSMAALRRMAAAKGAVMSLLLHAYQRRDEVGLIAFRSSSAELLLPLTGSVELASARLRELPTGGRTPLASALQLAHATLARRTRTGATGGSALVVLISDGRANVPLGDADPHAATLAAAQILRSSGAASLVVDSEDGPIRLGLARRVCAALNGHYLRLTDLLTATGGFNPLVAAVQLAHTSGRGSA
jgi:magnesium chelatase subunit D